MYQHEDQSFRNRPKFMSDVVFEQVLARAAEYCDREGRQGMRLCFHGGEPTLIGTERFVRFARRSQEVLGSKLRGIVLQTNGTLLNDDWAAVLAEHGVGVGISLDGLPELHDAVRINHAGRGSYSATVRGLTTLQSAGFQPKVLCVVNPRANGGATYRHLRSLGIRDMSFLLPDVSHDNKHRLYEDCGPTPVADYLIDAYDQWLRENDHTVIVQPFAHLLHQIWGAPPATDAFGNPSMSYLIVESDGGIHALDALRVCDESIDSSGLNVFSNSFDDLAYGSPLVYRIVHEGIRPAEQCLKCHQLQVCGGGYLPHRYAHANGFDNPSVWCLDILKLLAHLRQSLDKYALL